MFENDRHHVVYALMHPPLAHSESAQRDLASMKHNDPVSAYTNPLQPRGDSLARGNPYSARGILASRGSGVSYG